MAITRVGTKKQDQSDKSRSKPGGQTSRAKNAAEMSRLQQQNQGGQGGFGGDKK